MIRHAKHIEGSDVWFSRKSRGTEYIKYAERAETEDSRRGKIYDRANPGAILT